MSNFEVAGDCGFSNRATRSGLCEAASLRSGKLNGVGSITNFDAAGELISSNRTRVLMGSGDSSFESAGSLMLLVCPFFRALAIDCLSCPRNGAFIGLFIGHKSGIASNSIIGTLTH